MQLIPSDLAAGNAGGNLAAGPAMATAARQAIFADALLAAAHARLQELRSVAK